MSENVVSFVCDICDEKCYDGKIYNGKLWCTFCISSKMEKMHAILMTARQYLSNGELIEKIDALIGRGEINNENRNICQAPKKQKNISNGKQFGADN